jgi:hypothetical protein
MTQPIPSNRPKFEQIFNSKDLWALDKNELIIDNKMKCIIKEESKDKQSIYHIIHTKLFIDQIESTVKQVLDLNSVSEEGVKQSISGEEKVENLKVVNQVICELKDILISETKLNSENDSINKCCDCSHSSHTTFSTPEPKSKKRKWKWKQRYFKFC